MKDKLKNTLEHEVELLGRSISVLAIAGLLVVGGASAALLNSFGTIDGQANVDQAITVNNAGETELGTFGAEFEGSNSVTAGDVVSGVNTDLETTEASFTISNNLEESYTPEFTTTVDGDTTTDLQFTWDSDGIVGDGEEETGSDAVVRTTYANYFADAGANLGEYESSIDSGDSDVVTLTENPASGDSEVGSWEEAVTTVNDDNSFEHIYVENGDYEITGTVNEIVVDSAITISGEDPEEISISTAEEANLPASRTIVAVDAKSNKVTVEGLGFEEVLQRDGANAISVKGDEVVVRSNRVNAELQSEDDQGEWSASGIALSNNERDVSSMKVVNNKISVNENVLALSISDWQDDHNVDGAVVRGNTMEGPSQAIHIAEGVKNTVIKSNVLDAEVGVYQTDYDDSDGYTYGQPSGTNLTGNRLVTSGKSIEATHGSVDAENNFFAQGTWGSTNSNNFEGDVDASFQTVGSIDSGESVDVAPVHEFALMANGAESYSLSTTIQ